MNPQQQSQSLRAGTRGVASTALRGARPDLYSRPQEPAIQARPLPSQRAGTHQTAGVGREAMPGRTGSGSSVGSASAQDRLKARLWGAAKTVQAQGAQPSMATSRSEPSGFERGGNTGAYGGGYEDRGNSGVSSAGGGPRGGADKPFVAATAPWASNEDEFMGGGYGGSYIGGRRAGVSGPPSGPRGYR